MSFLKSSVSALGKLFTVAILLGTFAFGIVAVVYLSLQGEEIKVPELVGKDFITTENELAKLGLKIKRRADRVSREKQNTILEQLPKAGETVKTGQMILVVVSKFDPNGIVPDTIKKDDPEEDIKKIEELISDKPKKSSANDNSNKKKTTKTRDVAANTSVTEDTDKSDKKTADSGDKAATSDDKKTDNATDKSTPKPGDKPATDKPETKKPVDKNAKPAATPASGTTRPRKTP